MESPEIISEIRCAFASDESILYDLLKEYTIEQKLEDVFKNSRASFEEHFNQALFKAFVIEVKGETENQRNIIGCIFFSIFYEYVVGVTAFPHCCYIKPDFRDLGFEQKLIQHAKKISGDANIDKMLTLLTTLDAPYGRALVNEGITNLSRSIEIDVWIMTNQTSTNTLTYDDYIIRDGTEEDLSKVYDLLEELADIEDITADFVVNKDAFARGGATDKNLFSFVVLECQHRVKDQTEETNHTNEIVGCMLYSKIYCVLMGQLYFLQGLYLKQEHKGKGLGKALLRSTLQACKKCTGDGFIFMIHKDNKTSQSLFQSFHAINMTQSMNFEWIKILL
ncbi:uncharacterized protein LOC121418428 [Lytechinus variegatus]|uniref:uncharacterized protein LOC121418428 n=1 Tax=Lytechinus variegatus TaxID=7654 RepID=UPI001BB1941B|nr:uncharacterized protein LOC121418428 [Lytechinus variegatus]